MLGGSESLRFRSSSSVPQILIPTRRDEKQKESKLRQKHAPVGGDTEAGPWPVRRGSEPRRFGGLGVPWPVLALERLED